MRHEAKTKLVQLLCIQTAESCPVHHMIETFPIEISVVTFLEVEMTTGEKLAEAILAYSNGSDASTLPQMLHEQFVWESWTKIMKGLQTETKATTLELFSNTSSDDETKVFLATDDLLVVGYRGDEYGSILLTFELHDGVATKAFSARGETP